MYLLSYDYAVRFHLSTNTLRFDTFVLIFFEEEEFSLVETLIQVRYIVDK